LDFWRKNFGLTALDLPGEVQGDRGVAQELFIIQWVRLEAGVKEGFYGAK